MHKECVNEETSSKKGILKKGQSSEAKEDSATLYDMNNYQSMASGGPVYVHAPERIEQLPKAEETAAKLYTEHGGKNSGDFKMKFKPLFFRRGCSKHCTGVKRDLHTSSFELTVCEPPKKNKLAYRIKRSKRKVLQLSDQVKKRTKKSVKKIRKIYKNIGAKRAMGFNCDLKKCPSTIEQCSETSCAKPNMLFSKLHKLKGKILKDKEEMCGGVCCSSTGTDATGHEFKVLKDQSVGTSVDKVTSK